MLENNQIAGFQLSMHFFFFKLKQQYTKKWSSGALWFDILKTFLRLQDTDVNNF